MDISVLNGMVLTEIKGGIGDDEIVFTTNTGRRFRLFHEQDCCESVSVEDICGELGALVGNPILRAEERTSDENPPGVKMEYQESFTWTFYELATIKGSVTIRWYGESNGYYSESVDFEEIDGIPFVEAADELTRLRALNRELVEVMELASIWLESANAGCTQDTAFIIRFRAALAKAREEG